MKVYRMLKFHILRIITYQRQIQYFPEGASTQKGRAVTAYYLAKTCRKLHEDKENWIERRHARQKFY